MSKKLNSAATASTAPIAAPPSRAPAAEPAKPVPATPATPPQATAEPEKDQKQWTNSYATIFTSTLRGFEMGEDRRFKQRVFKFTEKPEKAIIDVLKTHGFTYRPKEKSWTIAATPDTRKLTEQLARQFAGGEQAQTR